jgi:hypothetical protein
MDGILNAYHRSMKPFYTKSFEEKVQCFLAFPHTSSINKKDFDAPTCYYSCNEKNECDFSQCIQKVNETSFPNQNVEKFNKEVVEKYSKCLSIAHNMDGLMISYGPDTKQSSKTVMCMMNNKQHVKGRIGVIELNDTRLKILNQF